MAYIDQSGLSGKIRNKPISRELENLLRRSAIAAGIDKVMITSGSQPGTTGRTTGSTRHNYGRAADLKLYVGGNKLEFSDSTAPIKVKKFVTACAANGALGIGAGVEYMGKATLHIGYGKDKLDNRKIVWGANGRSKNAPNWLRKSASEGWSNPPDWIYDIEEDFPEDLPENKDNIYDRSDSHHDLDSFDIPDRFTKEVIHAAQASQKIWGIPASITLAQWALESGYGRSMPSGSNNPFGIKALPGEPSVEAWTTEFIGGENIKVRESFRAFPTMEAAFVRHSQLLGTSGLYSSARQHLENPEQFADALTGVYATDPNYGSKLKSIMRSNNLFQFDLSSNLSGSYAAVHQDEAYVARVQQKLIALGFDPGTVDGKFGPRTAAAVFAYQDANTLHPTGILDSATQQALSLSGDVANKSPLPGQDNESQTIVPIILALIEILRKKTEGPGMTNKSESELDILRNLLEQLNDGSSLRKNTQKVGPVGGWLGQGIGRLLNGRKTGLGIIGMLASVFLPGLFPSVFGPLVDLLSIKGTVGKEAVEGQTLMQWIFGALTTWGIADKIEKAGKKGD